MDKRTKKYFRLFSMRFRKNYLYFVKNYTGKKGLCKRANTRFNPFFSVTYAVHNSPRFAPPAAGAECSFDALIRCPHRLNRSAVNRCGISETTPESY